MKKQDRIRQLGLIVLTIIMVLSGMCSEVVRADSLLSCMPQAYMTEVDTTAHPAVREEHTRSYQLREQTASYQTNQSVKEVIGTRGESLAASETHRQVSSSKKNSALAQSIWTVCVKNQRLCEERKCSGIGKNIISRDIIVCYMHHKDGSKG